MLNKDFQTRTGMKRFLLLSFISAALLTLALVGLEHAMIMSRAGEGIGMKLAARAPASTQHRTGSFGGVAGNREMSVYSK